MAEKYKDADEGSSLDEAMNSNEFDFVQLLDSVELGHTTPGLFRASAPTILGDDWKEEGMRIALERRPDSAKKLRELIFS